jgi:hypothetical protein
MILEDIKNIKSTKKELRKFGIIVSIVLALWAVLFLCWKKDYYFYFFILSATFLLLGTVVPILLKSIQKAWMTVAILINWVTSRVILSILFYVIFTPIGLILKLFGKDFLDVKISKAQKSYWNYRQLKDYDKQKYEQQF